MKKLFVIAIMAIVAMTANAQQGDIRITPHLGLGYANMSNTKMIYMMPLTENPYGEANLSNCFAFFAGADAEYMVSDQFGVSAGLDVLVAKSDVKEVELPDYKFSTGDMYFNYTYINVPILAQYHFGQFAVKAGLQPAFLVAADSHRDGHKESMKDACNKFNLSLPVGLSYEFKNTPIVLDLRYALPLTKVNKESVEGGKNNKFSTVTLAVGYRF